MKKFIVLLVTIISISGFAQQLVDSGSLIQGGIDDGEKLLGAYITPINKAIVFGLSDVTYTKIKKEAKHRLLLSVKLAYVSVPDEDFTYDVSTLNLQHIEAKDPNKTIAQSVFGDSIKTITMVSKDSDIFGRRLFEFETPKGGGKEALPLPFLGASLRLKYTNLSVNFIPYVPVPTSDLSIGMLGFSIQQDVSMFVKGLREKPYGLSLQGSASAMYGNAPLDVKPDAVTVPVTLNGSHPGPYDTQELNIFYTSINVGAYIDYTIAKKYTFFAGGGINMGTSRILLNGNYPIYAKDPSGTGAVVATDIEDPVDMSDSFSRTKYEVGFRADWSRFFLQLNYNMATYGGVGLNLGYKML
jgi:hypothetical protein